MARAAYQPKPQISRQIVNKECYWRVKTPNGWIKMPEEDALEFKGRLPVQRVSRITQFDNL